jgi:putative isomerase
VYWLGMTKSPYLRLLANRIDPSRSAWSDRGSRLLVFHNPHVPHLVVQTAEREPGAPSPRAHLPRPPIIRRLDVIDGQGQGLDYKLTTFPHALLLETRLGTFALSFCSATRLAIGLPPQEMCGVRLHLSRDIRLDKDPELSWACSCHAAQQRRDGEDDGMLAEIVADEASDRAIHLLIPGEADHPIYVEPFSVTIKRSEKRWQGWFASVPSYGGPYSKQYYYAWWVMANNLVSPAGYLLRETLMPSKSHYVGTWNWDACFHAIGLRHVDPALARHQLRTILAWQNDAGMLPDAVDENQIITHLEHPLPGDVTKPPLIAWAAEKIHALSPDREFLWEIYEPLVGWHTWWRAGFDKEIDLAQYAHPYASGMDDSPLWDYGMPVVAPDLNTYLIVQMQCLARFAQALGKRGEAKRWRQRSTALIERLIARTFNSEQGIFEALHDGKPIEEVTLNGLFPLWTNLLPSEVEEALVAKLTDKESFWTEYPLATVSRASPNYSPDAMWRGPAWPPLNYIFIEALARVGRPSLAATLRERTLAALAKGNDLCEYYNSETGEPGKHAAPSFGWTAAVFIDLALQEGQALPAQRQSA